MDRRLRMLFAAALGALLLWAAPASAQFSCAVTAPGAINFLVYNPASGTPAIGSTDTTLTCTHLSGGVQRIDWTMVLSDGGSGNCNARTMAGPGSTLNYNVYQTTVGGGVWGNAACATFPAGRLTVGPGAGNGTRSTTQTLFGQIPIGQFVSAGIYSDSLQLTIEYN
jgi:spore coat protein U-like protein